MNCTMSTSVLLAISLWSPAMANDPILVVDGHAHDVVTLSDGRLDLSGLVRSKSLGIDVAVLPLPLDRSAADDLEARIANERSSLERAASRTGDVVITDPECLLSDRDESAVGLLFSVEWFGEIFAGDPGRVERFRDLGVRVISFTEGDPDGLFRAGDSGPELTPFGEHIVSAMNGSGVVIDITHLSRSQMLEIIERSNAPVVASHSLVAAVCPTRFNLSDEVVSALAAKAGSVWVSFNASDLLPCNPDGDPIELLVDHVESLITTLGADHVGIGTDLQAAGKYVPAELNREGIFLEIGRRLADRGYSGPVVEGVLGRNILRALAAAGIRKPRGGSTSGEELTIGEPVVDDVEPAQKRMEEGPPDAVVDIPAEERRQNRPDAPEDPAAATPASASAVPVSHFDHPPL